MGLKTDDTKRVRRTWVRKGKLRNIMRFLVWLAVEHGAEIRGVDLWVGTPARSGRRMAPDDAPRKGKTPKSGRPAKKSKRKATTAEHKKSLARERSKRYRERQKQKQQ